MKTHDLHKHIVHATKWSSVTQVMAKIVSPVSNMILARILAPEAFGVVATATMIFSFADMFTDAGFQKYLIQHEFKDDNEKYENANVAFWTNLAVSLVLWGIIALFSEPIATLVGNPGLGSVITISCMQLPLTSFSSIQMALYRREFDFKTLFWIRMIAIIIPFGVTIPLAFNGFSYWSLIIGSITGQLFNAVLLTLKSKWKPRWFYRLKMLKEMLSFSIWTLIEAISIWFTGWVDVFIIGSTLNDYDLGIYKTSTAMVNAIMGVVTASVIPILFSALSRLQNKPKEFNKMYFSVQRLVSIFIFPLGVGMFLFSDFVTQIILGSQWSEASGVIGNWALTSSIVIVFGYFCSEVYRAKGKPKLSFLAQILHLVVLVPVCVISSQKGFWPLVYARSWVRMEAVLVHFIIMGAVIGISASSTLKNVYPTAVSAIIMGIAGFFIKQLSDGIVWTLVSIAICILLYLGVLCTFPNMRKEVAGIMRKIKRRSIRQN